MIKQRHSIFTIIIMTLTMMLVCNGLVIAKDSRVIEWVKNIDSFLKLKYKVDSPGTAVLAVKDGKVVYRKAVGMANMELGVPIKPDMVFRIGSITKHFTAAAIMMLVEEGKIKLDDEITKYLPKFPTKDTRITIHHLLNHTSGIKSYTSMKSFFKMMRKDMKVQEIINVSKNEQRDFKPGESWLYNNSGYIILGAIIEKVSGKSYEEFIDEKIFKPLNMNSSYYGSHSRIIPNRVAGYSAAKEGFQNAAYLSMRLPYAAGSLLSNVDDLWTWTKALHSGKVVSQKSFAAMTAPTTTTDGEKTDYGYGLSVEPIAGFKQVEHGGGINGFLTQIIYLPEQKVFVAVLNNCTGKLPVPSYVAQWITLLLCDKLPIERKAAVLDTKILDEVVGFYKIDERDTRIITREGNQLFWAWEGGPPQKLYGTKDLEFFYDNSFSYFTLERNKKGKVLNMISHRLSGETKIATKTNKKPEPMKKKEKK
jgi:CubicO group peptidase (beta-lactamase class C family)